MTTKVEYRVRPVTKYIVTRYEEEETQTADGPRFSASGAETRGQYENEDVAYQVAYALCKAEHDKSGEPLDSMNFIYPESPDRVKPE